MALIDSTGAPIAAGFLDPINRSRIEGWDDLCPQQCGVCRVTGHSLANEASAKACMTSEKCVAVHQDDPEYVNKLNVWESLGPNLEPCTNAWNAVKAAQSIAS